jgi:hypothetical protein
VPRRVRPVAEVGLRDYLAFEAVQFRESCGLTPTMFAELSKPLDQLLGGEAYRFYRWELPDDHPDLTAGGINDLLVLTEDDKLLLYEDWLDAELAAVSRPQHH